MNITVNEVTYINRPTSTVEREFDPQQIAQIYPLETRYGKLLRIRLLNEQAFFTGESEEAIYKKIAASRIG